MASLHSRWESRLVIPTGGWDFDLDETGGGTGEDDYAAFTAADTFYWSSAGSGATDFAAELKAKLEAASLANGNGFVYTVTIDAGEGGTGKLTIAVSAGEFTLTNVPTDFLDLMGFTGDLTPAAASFTGQNHVQGLWMPDCPVETPYGLSSSGLPISAAAVSLSEDGSYYASHGSKHVRNEYVYQAVSVAKVVAAQESSTNASYETWWLDSVRGEEPWANAGRQVRFYKDVSDDATYVTFNVIEAQRPDIQRSEPDYDGFWRVRLVVTEN